MGVSCEKMCVDGFAGLDVKPLLCTFMVASVCICVLSCACGVCMFPQPGKSGYADWFEFKLQIKSARCSLAELGADAFLMCTHYFVSFVSMSMLV